MVGVLLSVSNKSQTPHPQYPRSIIRPVSDALHFLEDATGYRRSIQRGSTGSEDALKDLEYLDSLHKAASDPSSWISSDMGLPGRRKAGRKATRASPSSGTPIPSPSPGASSSTPSSSGSPGELQRFLDHTALMSDMDDLKDKVWPLTTVHEQALLPLQLPSRSPLPSRRPDKHAISSTVLLFHFRRRQANV